jgi:hypothetical protein
MGGLDGACGLGRATIGHMGDLLAIGRVAHRVLGAAVGIHPGAVDKGLLAQQVAVL